MLPRKVLQPNEGWPLCQFLSELPDGSKYTTSIFVGQCPYCLAPVSCTKNSILLSPWLPAMGLGLEDGNCYVKCQNLLKFPKKFTPFSFGTPLNVAGVSLDLKVLKQFTLTVLDTSTVVSIEGLGSGASYSAIICDVTLVQFLIYFNIFPPCR